jgi:hypothetical protein
MLSQLNGQPFGMHLSLPHWSSPSALILLATQFTFEANLKGFQAALVLKVGIKTRRMNGNFTSPTLSQPPSWGLADSWSQAADNLLLYRTLAMLLRS